MRCPNPNCDHLFPPILSGHTAHVVTDDIDSLDIGDGLNSRGNCGTCFPATRRYPLSPPTRGTAQLTLPTHA